MIGRVARILVGTAGEPPPEALLAKPWMYIDLLNGSIYFTSNGTYWTPAGFMQGAPSKSTYDLACTYGFEGTPTEWLQSLKGATGAQGATGSPGAPGAIGAIGNTGLTGAKGDTGVQGNTGSQGIKGDTGSQGIKGDTGNIGSQGIQGIQGNAGEQGIKGDTGLTGSQGNAGAQGIQGIQGTAGPMPSLGTTPSTQAFGDALTGGVAVDAAKTDHKHAMPAYPDPHVGSLAPGSFTLATGKFAIFVRRLTLTSSQRITMQGSCTIGII